MTIMISLLLDSYHLPNIYLTRTSHTTKECIKVIFQSRYLQVFGLTDFCLVIATAHLLFFHFLNNNREDVCSSSTLSQTYVTAASTIMANVFGLFIKAVLGAVVTQYLSPLRVMTIEALLTFRTNPLSLFSTYVLRNGWLLVIIAVLIWITSITANFPPNAITVVTASCLDPGVQDGIPGLNVSSVNKCQNHLPVNLADNKFNRPGRETPPHFSITPLPLSKPETPATIMEMEASLRISLMVWLPTSSPHYSTYLGCKIVPIQECFVEDALETYLESRICYRILPNEPLLISPVWQGSCNQHHD